MKGTKNGSHTLRHSLASRLLEHEIPLPVISEILGHTTTETTMIYLRIDISELRKCALEVAILHDKNQKISNNDMSFCRNYP